MCTHVRTYTHTQEHTQTNKHAEHNEAEISLEENNRKSSEYLKLLLSLLKCSFLRTLNACECARVCDATDKGQTATAGKPVILEMHQQILQNEEYIKLSSQMKCEDCGLTLYKLE